MAHWPPWLITIKHLSHTLIAFNSAVNFLIYAFLWTRNNLICKAANFEKETLTIQGDTVNKKEKWNSCIQQKRFVRKDDNKEKNTKWQSDKGEKIKSTTKRENKVDWEEHDKRTTKKRIKERGRIWREDITFLMRSRSCLLNLVCVRHCWQGILLTQKNLKVDEHNKILN